ncbi:MAG: (2Fe-2S)-binding protein [Gemmatimonadota bacterium]|nr:MAG: (2Fe-2S)-binding protein [Gemmatimonadota bacterium]
MDNDRKLINVTIDGIEVSVPEGKTILEAAERLGIVIPRYCYHPALSAPAQCRMCLVEVEGAPKPLPSCVQQVQDGMVVSTDCAEARKARRGVIEFLLLNHPLDCPICDAAGQCMLQDYAHETGQLRRRAVEPTVVLGRDHVTSEIVYFADRCILCTRCVRFMEEIAEEPVLQVIQRGHKGYIDTMTDELFEHPFSMNIVDVCPVGALVNEDFLFKARSWDLDQTASICPGCSQGCNVLLGTKEQRVVRLKPRPNPEVNSHWMCDYGRREVVRWGAGIRAEVPMVRESDRLVAIDWSRALDALVEALSEASGGAKAIVSPGASNESLFTLRSLMERVGFEGGYFHVTTGSEQVLKGFPKLALREDRAANARGAELLGFERVDYVYGALLGHRGVVFVLEEALDGAPEDFGEGVELFIYIGSHLSPAAGKADIVLPCPIWAEMEGTFTNFEDRVQRFNQALRPPGLARPIWLSFSVALARLGAGEPFTSVAAAFGALAEELGVYSGLSYERIGLNGATTAAAGSAAAARR